MTAGFRMATALVAALGAACAGGTSPRNLEVTHDGLERVADAKLDRAWIKPDADFSRYTQVVLLDCDVAFRRNWEMRHPDVRARDMERIKRTLAEECRKVFGEALEGGGYPVASAPAGNALLIRPAIIDLDIAAPATNSAGRSRSFTTWPGAMTLVIELHDSVSNEILARAIDRRRARNVGGIRWTTSGTNREAARRVLQQWASLLVDRLDEIHGERSG